MLVVEPTVEKVEDEDTDVEESAAPVAGSDSEKMDTTSETKPREEPETAGSAGDKENGVKPTKDSQPEIADSDTGKAAKAEKAEDKVGKDADEDKTEDSADKEKTEEKKEEVAVEDEEEEPEPEDEVTEDRDDGGEDPSEVEVEKYNMPLEQTLLSGKCSGCMSCHDIMLLYLHFFISFYTSLLGTN